VQKVTLLILIVEQYCFITHN